MQRLERGFEFIKQAKSKAKEKVRNIVPLHADSIEELVQLSVREQAASMEIRSLVETVYHATGGSEWGFFPIATSSPPDMYLPKTIYEARGLGRRVVMDEIHAELDGKSSKNILLRAQLRCELTAEQRREMLSALLPNIQVTVKRTLDNKEEQERVINSARALKLTPYETNFPS